MYTLTEIEAIIHCQQPLKFLFKKDPPNENVKCQRKLFKMLGIGESCMIDDLLKDIYKEPFRESQVRIVGSEIVQSI